MTGLPKSNCLAVAITTPVTRDYRPDAPRLVARASLLLRQGCDGIALFGTTGEGAGFSVEDRIAALEAVVAGGIEPARIVVSVGAASIPDVAKLSAHAVEFGAHGMLLMPPCVYRSGISEDGTFGYYASIIERISRADLRIYLYHFPAICGVPITAQLARRLDESFPGIIAGIKDSGGELDFTLDLIQHFPHLSIFTGSEAHVPDALAAGGRGTICGLANIMPRLLRAMMDAPSASERSTALAFLLSGDNILSPQPFVPSVKAIVAEITGDAEWARLAPPMSEIPPLQRQNMMAAFHKWNAELPPAWRSLATPA